MQDQIQEQIKMVREIMGGLKERLAQVEEMLENGVPPLEKTPEDK